MKYIFLIIVMFLANTCIARGEESQTDKTQKIISKLENIISKGGNEYGQSILRLLENKIMKHKTNGEKIKILNEIEYNLIKNGKINPIKYAIANGYTPIFYTPEINDIFGGKDGKTLKLDNYHQIDETETIALTGTVFEIYGEIKNGSDIIYKVYSKEYNYLTSKGYYIDSRFVKTNYSKPESRNPILPDKQTIIQRMEALSGGQYIRGGNAPMGVDKIWELYPARGDIDEKLKSKWILSGVDCSGLLYYATDGYTPRNTSDLINYGSGVDIQGLTGDDIISKLQPLDIIVRKGHMIMVLDKDNVIESVYERKFGETDIKNGVLINNTKDILKQILENRTPINDYNDPNFKNLKKFVVRRWYR